MAAPAGWAALPPWARWILAYLAILGGSALLGFLTPLGAGNAVFLAGAGAVFASLLDIRLGGPRALVGRDLKGHPKFDLDGETRRHEIRRGLSRFALGLALWAALLGHAALA